MKKEKRKPTGEKCVRAIPPDDYEGSIADWMVGLQEMGVWDGQNPEWHGDVWLTPSQFVELLTKCEK